MSPLGSSTPIVFSLSACHSWAPMTIFVLEPIYPETDVHPIIASQAMMDRNYELWKKTYEEFYNTKLTYLCGDIVKKA